MSPIQLFAPEPQPAGFLAPRVSRDNRRQSALLTASGGLSQDGSRQRFGALDTSFEGDGRDPESSTGFYRATTNLIANGGFETNTTGWTLSGATSITRITTAAKYGNAAAEIVTPNAIAGEGVYHTFAATAVVYSLQVWAKGSGTIRLAVARDSDGGLSQVGTTFTLTSSWQKIVFTPTALTATTWRFIIHTNVQQGLTFQVDGAQCETMSARSPYIETNGATASRTAGRVQMPTTSLDETQGWFAARVRFDWNQSGPLGSQVDYVLFDWRDDATHRIGLEYTTGAGGKWSLVRTAGAGVAHLLTYVAANGAITTVIGAWTATLLKLSKDGAAFTTLADASIPTLTVATAEIGQAANIGANYEFAGEMFWFATGTGTLTDANAATIAAFGNVGNQPAVFPGSCKLYWQGLNSKALTAV